MFQPDIIVIVIVIVLSFCFAHTCCDPTHECEMYTVNVIPVMVQKGVLQPSKKTKTRRKGFSGKTDQVEMCRAMKCHV